MCTVSMIYEHYRDRWQPLVPWYPQPWQPEPVTPMSPADFQKALEVFKPAAPAITPAEVAEFRKLLERAREYDKRMNQPDCELDAKREILKQLAAALGLDISFVDVPPAVDAVDPALAARGTDAGPRA